jgi:ribosomal-protein-alanine N-acetyltransferase
MEDFRIQKMKIDDLDEIIEIERESFSMPWSRWMFERELEDTNRAYFLVARNNYEIFGYIGFWIVFDEAHIVTIAVRSDYRRKGIGTMLLASALVVADTLSAKKATLEVRVTNTSAQNMYFEFGFDTVSIRKGFYTDTNEDAYVMWIYDLKDNLKKIRSLGYKAQTRILNDEC